jgi:hypothetical protein
LNEPRKAFSAATLKMISCKNILKICWISPKPPIIVDGNDVGFAFAVANAETVRPLIGEPPSIYLTAGPGCFVGNGIGGRTADGSKGYIYGRMRTWVLASWLGPSRSHCRVRLIQKRPSLCGYGIGLTTVSRRWDNLDF